VGSAIAAMGFREGETDTVTVRYRVGSRYSDRTLIVEPGKGLGGHVLVTGRPHRTDDYASDQSFDKSNLAGALADDVVAAMVVPIKTEERVEGTLYVANRTRRLFTDRDAAILVRLAAPAHIAIKNAQLSATQRERHRRDRPQAEGAEHSSRPDTRAV